MATLEGSLSPELGVAKEVQGIEERDRAQAETRAPSAFSGSGGAPAALAAEGGPARPVHVIDPHDPVIVCVRHVNLPCRAHEDPDRQIEPVGPAALRTVLRGRRRLHHETGERKSPCRG